MKAKKIFNISYGNSGAIIHYDKGNIPYVSSGSKNNGVVEFIKTDEELFKKYSITIASKGSIGSAFVQPIAFIASKDNVIVLEEKEEKSLSIEEKYYYATYINKIKWRYSYGRTLSKTRVGNIDLPPAKELIDYKKTISEIIPKSIQKKKIKKPQTYKYFKLDKIYNILSGKGDYLINLGEGKTPLISATNQNNGILDHVNMKPLFTAPSITVERVSGSAFVQIEDFITVPDDVKVLEPIENKPIEFLFYTSALINKKRWKYNYGRKLSKNRLKKMKLYLPMNYENQIDLEYIKSIVSNCYGWNKIKQMINYYQTHNL